MSKLQHATTERNSQIHWKDLKVSSDGRYHLNGDLPAYDSRFDTVLKYHAPGLAPVRDFTGAYHINVTGHAIYNQRYLRTFGFYEERAAIQSIDGWFHILPDGSPLYVNRYAWCGNFQDGHCTIRGSDDQYFHISLQGEPAYPERYRYAGDYRDGIAVVQSEEGFHAHIDHAGHLVNDLWFIDLDVFHKGYARARDQDGWHHINLEGQPIYPQRYASVEPFYNGQARVEDLTGSFLIIDESGDIVIHLRPDNENQKHRLFV